MRDLAPLRHRLVEGQQRVADLWEAVALTDWDPDTTDTLRLQLRADLGEAELVVAQLEGALLILTTLLPPPPGPSGA